MKNYTVITLDCEISNDPTKVLENKEAMKDSYSNSLDPSFEGYFYEYSHKTAFGLEDVFATLSSKIMTDWYHLPKNEDIDCECCTPKVPVAILCEGVFMGFYYVYDSMVVVYHNEKV